MADDGAGIWGKEIGDEAETGVIQTSADSIAQRPTELERRESKPAPRLFDDLGDAGWGSPDPEEPSTIFDASPVSPVAPTELPKDSEFEESFGNEGFQEDQKELSKEVEDSPDEKDEFFDQEDTQKLEEDKEHLDSPAFEDFKDGFDEGEKGDDDDFGDFGDFEEEAGVDQFDSIDPMEESTAQAEQSFVGQDNLAGWQPLSIGPNSNSSSIASGIRDILSLPFADGRMYPFHDGAVSQLSQDKVRQVEGPSQVLVREESRAAWSILTEQPELKPVDWMRSKTRRQYLIAIGVPINLDELNASNSSKSKALPPLALKIDSGSRGSDMKEDQNGGSKTSNLKSSRERENKVPEIDQQRVKAVIAMNEDQLTLLGLPALRDLQRETETLTRQASTVLTHYLSQREAHAADAEMYNGLIRDLVTGAAKRVSTNSNMQRQASIRNSTITGSGRNSPAINSVQSQASATTARNSSPRR